MSYDDKALVPGRPGQAAREPHVHERGWSEGRQLRWYQVYSHVLALNVSEQCRQAAKEEAEKEAARWAENAPGAGEAVRSRIPG